MSVVTRNNVTISGEESGRPCCSPTASAATRTCGATSRPPSRPTTASCCSTTSGAGGSASGRLRPDRYSSLQGYAEDVLEICRELNLWRRRLRRPLGQRDGPACSPPSRSPDRFDKLILVGPSPRYID
jgi:sigma-B regulation protein RsbQ